MSEASLLVRISSKNETSRDFLLAVMRGEGEVTPPWDELPVGDEVKSRYKKGLSVFFEDTMDEEEASTVLELLAQQKEIVKFDACYYDSEGEYIVWRKVGDKAALVCRNGDDHELDGELAWSSPEKVLNRTAKLKPMVNKTPPKTRKSSEEIVNNFRQTLQNDPSVSPEEAEKFLTLLASLGKRGSRKNKKATQNVKEPKPVESKPISVGLSAGDLAWRPDDPEWLAQRKEEWPKVLEVRRLLTGWDPFKRKYDKFHKELFFTGRLNGTHAEIDEAFDWNLWLFEMGYHPEPSEEVFRAIARRHPDTLSANSLFLYAGNSDLTPEYGMFGGREVLITKILIPHGIQYFKDDGTSKAKVIGEGIDGSPDSINILASGLTKYHIAQWCIGNSNRILTDDNTNPHAPGRYLWTVFDRIYESEDIEKVFENELRDRLLPFLVAFNYNDRFHNRKYQETLKFAHELHNRFLKGGFSSKLMAAWHDTFNRFERGDFADNQFLQKAWEKMKASN